MTAIRKIYHDTPSSISIPQEFLGKTIEIIMFPIEDNQINDSSYDFKNWLQNMPDIDESIFKRY